MDYKSAGVDIDLADKFVERIKRMVGTTQNERVVSGVGGFSALYSLDDKRLLAASTDGVGTKLKLAFELNEHKTIGLDLVAMCVNDLLCCGARPMFFLDYFATGKLELETAEDVIAGIVNGCRQGRLALIGGETAEMPGMYAAGEYDLAGFAVGEVWKEDLLDGSKVKPGNTLIGISSSGFHSNGYSLVRKLLEKVENHAERKQLAREVLTPTRIYVDLVMGLREAMGESVHGLAHITGSGWLNIPRMNQEYCYEITDLPKEIPAAMAKLTQLSGLSQEELYRTFNMGVGLVVSTDRPVEMIQWLEGRGEKSWVIGKVTTQAAGEVILGNQILK